MASRLSRFLSELKRRKVYHVAGAYVVVGAVLGEVVNNFLPGLGAPEWAVSFLIVLILIGFPIALVLAWAYELRPEEPGAAPGEPGSGPAPPGVSAETSESQGSSEAVSSPSNDTYSRAGRPAERPVATVHETTDRSTGATSGPDRKSIVVLPFDNLSPDPDNAFFADGLTEEVIADLSKVKALRVISRTSAMAFKGTNKTVPGIARELNVRFALEGSVRREGESLRITAQLIDATSDAHLWAEKYSGTVKDVFDLQEDLSRRIVDALKVNLTPEEDRRLAARPIMDVQAHDIWLRARQHALTLTVEGVDRAKDLVEQALSLAGDNALLHATLAWVHAVRWGQLDEGADDAASLDPLSWLTTYAVPHTELYAGNGALAFEEMRELTGRGWPRASPGQPSRQHTLPFRPPWRRRPRFGFDGPQRVNRRSMLA